MSGMQILHARVPGLPIVAFDTLPVLHAQREEARLRPFGACMVPWRGARRSRVAREVRRNVRRGGVGTPDVFRCK